MAQCKNAMTLFVGSGLLWLELAMWAVKEIFGSCCRVDGIGA